MDLDPAHEIPPESEKILTVRLYGNHEAAGAAAARLKALGFECWVSSDDCSGMYPTLTTAQGVRLKVRAEDFEAVTALLEAEASPEEINQLEAEALAAVPPKSDPPKKLAWLQIGLGVLLGIFLCLFFQGQSDVGYKTHYAYTDDGRCYEAVMYRDSHVVEVCKDRSLAGRWDAWVYYNHGHVVRAEYDDNHDGQPDLWVTYSNGSPASAQQDTDYNGVPDLFCTYKNGLLQQIDVQPNGSKFTITREIYTNGLPTEIWRGGDSNGFFNTVEKYDPFFNKVETAHRYFNPDSTNASEPFQLLTPVAK